MVLVHRHSRAERVEDGSKSRELRDCGRQRCIMGAGRVLVHMDGLALAGQGCLKNNDFSKNKVKFTYTKLNEMSYNLVF